MLISSIWICIKSTWIWQGLELLLHSVYCSFCMFCDLGIHYQSLLHYAGWCYSHCLLSRIIVFGSFCVGILWRIHIRFIRENKEKSFVALNAPGIFSCFGFIGLFLLAAGVGSFLHQSKDNRGLSLVVLTALMGGCYWITGMIEPASRRSVIQQYWIDL